MKLLRSSGGPSRSFRKRQNDLNNAPASLNYRRKFNPSAAVADENTFIFRNSLNEEMERVKQFVEERIGNLAVDVPPVKVSTADELLKLASLKPNGAISDAEFFELKNQLIRPRGSEG